MSVSKKRHRQRNRAKQAAKLAKAQAIQRACMGKRTAKIPNSAIFVNATKQFEQRQQLLEQKNFPAPPKQPGELPSSDRQFRAATEIPPGPTTGAQGGLPSLNQTT